MRKTKTKTDPAETLQAVRDAISEGEKEVTRLTGERLALLRRLAEDPAGITSQVREVDQRIAEARTTLRTLQDVVEVAQADAEEAARQERVAHASNMIATAAHQSGLCPAAAAKVDHHARETIKALHELQGIYKSASRYAMSAVSILCADNPMQGFDVAATLGQLVSGQGIPHAKALARHIEHLLQTMGGHHIREEVIMADRYVGHRENIPSLEEAARIAHEHVVRYFDEATRRRIAERAADPATPLPDTEAA